MTGQDVTVTEMHLPHFLGHKRNCTLQQDICGLREIISRPLYFVMEKPSPKWGELAGRGFAKEMAQNEDIANLMASDSDGSNTYSAVQ